MYIYIYVYVHTSSMLEEMQPLAGDPALLPLLVGFTPWTWIALGKASRKSSSSLVHLFKPIFSTRHWIQELWWIHQLCGPCESLCTTSLLGHTDVLHARAGAF